MDILIGETGEGKIGDEDWKQMETRLGVPDAVDGHGFNNITLSQSMGTFLGIRRSIISSIGTHHNSQPSDQGGRLSCQSWEHRSHRNPWSIHKYLSI